MVGRLARALAWLAGGTVYAGGATVMLALPEREVVVSANPAVVMLRAERAGDALVSAFMILLVVTFMFLSLVLGWSSRVRSEPAFRAESYGQGVSAGARAAGAWPAGVLVRYRHQGGVT